MSHAWVYARAREAASEMGSALAELGFSPRYVDGIDDGGNGDLVPSGRDGAELQRPSLAVVVSASGEPAPSELLGRLRQADQLQDVGVLLAVEAEHLSATGELGLADELLVRPYSLAELRARIARLRTVSAGELTEPELIRAGSLELNLATYQVRVDGRPIGFAYMEYELLRFLVTHPNRVFSREALLSRVWGYDYFGGARTVDVHIRRVRAKLGQEHAQRIKTIRNVGYLFEAPR